MIIEMLINVLLLPLQGIIALLPDIDFPQLVSFYGSSGYGKFLEYVRLAKFFFPITTIMQIITFTILVFFLRIVIAFVRTVWDILPFT